MFPLARLALGRNVTKLRLLLLSGGAAAAVLLGSAAPAAADDTTAAPVTGQGAEEHCYVFIATGRTQCFPTFAGVTSAISGGKVVLQSPSELTKEMARKLGQAASSVPQISSAPADAVTVLGIVYDDVGYKGSTKQFLGASGDCAAGTGYSFASMPAGWNDRVSSFESLGRCRVTLFDGTNFQGSSYGPMDRASIGALFMNDRTSSVTFEL
jgi:hypothetical protein